MIKESSIPDPHEMNPYALSTEKLFGRLVRRDTQWGSSDSRSDLTEKQHRPVESLVEV